MTTPSDIILQALKKSGVLGDGQTASDSDFNDAFLDLNDMLAQWQRKRWLIWNLTDYAKVSTGAQSYSVGTGGDYDVPRPDRIESAFLRQLINSNPNQVDYPLEILESREDYNRITLKQLMSLPFCIFYDAAYPVGRIYPWPVPQPTIYEVHITLKTNYTVLTSLAQTINMPPEYIAALKWNLAIRLRESYQLPPRDSLTKLATDSLNVLRKANTQIPLLQMPNDIIPIANNYNIFSDRPN